MDQNQERRAWRMLMKGGNNSDHDIAMKIGSTQLKVSKYLDARLKRLTEKINKKVNERHKANEEFKRLESKRQEKFLLHNKQRTSEILRFKNNTAKRFSRCDYNCNKIIY